MTHFRALLLLITAMALQACQPEAPAPTADQPPAEEASVAEPAAAAPSPQRAMGSAIANLAGRTEEDAARDAGRKPAEVLAFLDLQPGMTVLEVWAGGGWYSEVLSAAVGPDGRVLIQNPPRLLEMREGANDKALAARLQDGRLGNAERLDKGLGEVNIPPESIDLAFTALNFHDIYYLVSPEAAAATLATLYGVLKPGAVLGIVDHFGAPDGDNAKLHRIDPQIVRNMATKAGYIVEGDSGLLYNQNDDLSTMVFDPAIRGKTHRFVLRLRKPAAGVRHHEQQTNVVAASINRRGSQHRRRRSAAGLVASSKPPERVAGGERDLRSRPGWCG